MAITIDWGQAIIYVNKVDMVQTQILPTEIYQLDMDGFRKSLKDLEDTENGMMFTDTHRHNPPVTISGAVLARVVEILEPFTVTFEDGQYRVNVVGANTNIGERVNVNQVSVSTSNSAGLQDLNSLQAASFGGEVSVDINSAFSTTAFPTGTRANPVNNMAAAHQIADERGITTFRIMSSMTLNSEDYSDSHNFYGASAVSVLLTIAPGANVSNCTFENLTIQGELDQGNVIRDCSLLDIVNINGFMHQCALSGIITLGGNAQATIMSCYSGVAGGVNTAKIDMGGSGQSLVLRDYSGGVEILNHSGTDPVSIDMNSGQVIVAASVTAGDITLRGSAKLRDRSTGTAFVDHTGLVTGTVTVQAKGEVLVDSTTSNTGIEYPLGTTFAPVNNIADAILIADDSNIKNIHSIKDITVQSGDDITDYVIKGHHSLTTTVTLTTGCTTLNTKITDSTITGVAQGPLVLSDSVVSNLSGLCGFIRESSLVGTLTLAGGDPTSVVDCFNGDVLNTPIIDMGGAGNPLAMRNYNGEIKIINKTGTDIVHIDIGSGVVEIDSTVTNGTIIIHGTCLVIDNSTGTTVVDVDGVVNKSAVSDQVWDESVSDHITAGTVGRALSDVGYLSKCVYLDTESVPAGTGTQLEPFNTLALALDYAELVNIGHIIVKGDIIIDRNLKNFTITGVGVPEVDANGKDLTGSELERVRFKGTYLGPITVQESVLLDGSYLNGFFENCVLNGTSTCIDAGSVLLKNSASNIAGLAVPVISMNGIGASKLSIRGYQGGLDITDCNNALDEVTVEINPGYVTLKSSCTAGTMVVRGVGSLVDETNGSTVVDETLSPSTNAVAVWAEDTIDAPIGTAGFILNKIKTILNLLLG